MSLNRTLANLINTDGDVKAANLDLAASITVVEALDSLPTSNLTAGDQAYVKGTSRFYVSNGAGWYNAALVNATPSLSIDPSGAITLATDGSTTTITLTATDSDYPDAALTYTVDSDGSFGGLGTISQDSSVFTITPLSEDSATTTSSTLTFKASDGISFGSGTSVLSLTFKVVNSNYTTLLLKADSDGTDNQVDASTNARTVSEYGNVTSTAFTPYHPGGYSIYFDGGASTRLTPPSDTGFAFGTGAYTVEAWIYISTSTTGAVIFDAGAANGSFSFLAEGGLLRLSKYGTGPQISSSAGAVNTNQWHHCAIVRTSNGANDTRLYVDGVLVGTGTDANNWTVTTTPSIGGSGFANYTLNGYLRDLRVVKGTAVYTSAFTPPDEPLTAITNTELLTCHLPYIADGSTNSHSITVAGNTKTERFGPYDYLGYAKADHGGSVYFDGTGDYIQTPNGTYMDYGSGDFTFEAWIYPTASDGDRHIASDYASSGHMTSGSFHTLIDDGILRTYARVGGVNIIGGLDGTTTIQLNVWHHVALVRYGNVFTLYLNGASEASTTQSGAMNVSTQPFTIGRAGNYAGALFQGYISNARLVKGTAVYTSAFTPPTEPLTAITNTELLTCTNQNDIWDASAVQPLLSRFNSIAALGTKSGWSDNAIYFNRSSSQYMTIPQSDNLVFGTGDFTLETWVFFNTISDYGAIFDFRTTGTQVAPLLWAHPDNYFYWYINGSTRIQTANSFISANTWYHVAVARSGSSTKMFVNGTQQGSTYADTNNYVAPGVVYIGRSAVSDDHHLNGYLIDTRITKGLARYTANFTPPITDFSG